MDAYAAMVANVAEKVSDKTGCISDALKHMDTYEAEMEAMLQ